MKTAKEVCEVEIAAFKEAQRLAYETERSQRIRRIISYLISKSGEVTFRDCGYYPDREYRWFIEDPFYKEEFERLGYKVMLFPTIKKWWGTQDGWLFISACCGEHEKQKE